MHVLIVTGPLLQTEKGHRAVLAMTVSEIVSLATNESQLSCVSEVGERVGLKVGFVGGGVGVGPAEGSAEGAGVGSPEGAGVGEAVGCSVGSG